MASRQRPGSRPTEPARSVTGRSTLRERNKNRARRSIQTVAMQLFATQGYDQTTVDQIVEAAQISRSTFFRYFPGKEELVFWDEYDDLFLQDLASQPATTQPIDLVRHVVTQVYDLALREDRDSLLARNRLIFATPALRSALAMWTHEIIDRTAPIVAAKIGRASDDLEVRITVAAALSVFTEVLRHWAAHDGREDLIALTTRGIDVLADGLRLKLSDPPPADAPRP